MISRTISIAAIAVASIFMISDCYMGRVYADDRHDRPCSEMTLRGSYGFYRTGTTPSGPLVSVGMIFFDGHGNFTATQDISRNGVFSFDSTFSGTYEVAEDCTGKSFFNGVEFLRMVVVDAGKEIYQLSATPGNTIYVVGKKIAGAKHGHDD